MRNACSHMAECCQDDKSWEKRQTGPVERGGVGLRICGAGEGLLDTLRARSGCAKQGLKSSDRVEQRKAVDSVSLQVFLSSTVSFVMPQENGWSKTLKEKESWLGHEDCAGWFCVNLSHTGVIRKEGSSTEKMP